MSSKWIGTVAVAMSLLVSGAQATIVMQDDFSGTSGGMVSGTTPDVLAPALSGNVWLGSGAVTFDGAGGIIGTVNSYRSSVFDISGAYGATDLLRLTVVLQNDEDKWASIGFAQAVAENDQSQNVGWVNVFGDGNGTPGSGRLREGPSFGTTTSALNTGLWNSGSANTVVIEYNLADDGDGNGSLATYVNGTLAATLADASAIGSPGYVHLAFNNTGGTTAGGQFFDHVTLEVIPEPATLGMVTLVGAAVLVIRRWLIM